MKNLQIIALPIFIFLVLFIGAEQLFGISPAFAQFGSLNPNLPGGSPSNVITQTIIPQQQIELKIRQEIASGTPSGEAKVLIFSNSGWSGTIRDSAGETREVSGANDQIITFKCQSPSQDQLRKFAVNLNQESSSGYLMIVTIQGNKMTNEKLNTEPDGRVSISDNCVVSKSSSQLGGGCLIATVAYGSELAPEVQKLREIRDAKLLQTKSGSSFVESFNQFYYSFSPTIADYERENPYFKEAVKLAITPMISSLSILNFVEMDSEIEVLGYGTLLILWNVGMYVGVPACLIIGVSKKF